MTVHPSLLERKIIHIDMDAFYAAIEERENPELKEKPVVIGGNPQSRGVVCTANYVARKFGIRSAMACARAYRLCPQAIFIRPRFELYSAVSKEIHAIFKSVTPHIEPLSLDEAYLDVTHLCEERFAMDIARDIKDEIYKQTQLTSSAGVAPNKLLAKIASDLDKPNGLTIIRPSVVEEFMKTVPLSRLPGIGPVTTARLAKHGLVTCLDATLRGRELLVQELGNFGSWLFEVANGLDSRPVSSERKRKSMGSETTFAEDILEPEKVRTELKKLCDEISQYLTKKKIQGRTVTLKVRYSDFSRITRSHTRSESTRDSVTLFETLDELIKKTDIGRRKIRLLGLSLSNLESD